MRIDVPHGEVVDRITILELKVARLASAEKVAQARAHLDALVATWAADGPAALESLKALPRLREVNTALWDVEEELRALERAARFDDRFVALARSVYQLNDTRSRLKASIDASTGSRFREPKSYA